MASRSNWQATHIPLERTCGTVALCPVGRGLARAWTEQFRTESQRTRSSLWVSILARPGIPHGGVLPGDTTLGGAEPSFVRTTPSSAEHGARARSRRRL